MTYYSASAPYRPGTALPNNVMGDCGHRHRTAQGALACIRRVDRAVKRCYGPGAFCDRMVMIEEPTAGKRRPWHPDDERERM